MSRKAMWLVLVGGVLVIVGVLLQAFSIAAWTRGAGEGALDMHNANSMTVHLGQILIVVGAIWAYWRRWVPIGLAILFLVLSFLQLVSVGDTDTPGGWVHGLHGLLAIVVLFAGAAYLHVAVRELDVRGRRSASS